MRSSSVLKFGETMHKYLSALLISSVSMIIPCISMTYDLIEEIEESNQTPKTIGEAIFDGALIGIKHGLITADIRRQEALIQQYYEQQIAYEEMMAREHEERQRQIALHYYIHSKHRTPTASQKKQADKITEDLNRN